MLRLAQSSIHSIPNNADRSKETAKCLDNFKCHQSQTGSVCAARLPKSYQNEVYQKTMIVGILHFYCIRNKEIYCTEMYLYCIELYIHYTYSPYILYRSVSPLVAQSYTV